MAHLKQKLKVKDNFSLATSYQNVRSWENFRLQELFLSNALISYQLQAEIKNN